MLYIPGGAFSFAATQTNADVPSATGGTVMTPAVGSKGAWAQVFASLDHDTYGLIITVHNSRSSAANRSYAIDVGIGTAGSEIVVIPDLIGSNAGLNNNTGGINYYFPIFIPVGTRVAIRAQGSVTTSCRAMVHALQQPINPAMVKTCGYVEAVGISGVVGTSLTTGTGSEGSWTSIGSTTRDLWWWQLGIQVAVADVTHAGGYFHFDLAVGDGTNFAIISQNIPFWNTTNEEAGKSLFVFGAERFVPSGSTIYARSQATLSDPLEVAVYGAG